MSNRKPDQLFELIKSLDPSEKRYLKLHAFERGRKTNYELLFGEISKLEAYDEDLLKQKFIDKKFIKQFNVTRQNLYTLILRTLRDFHTDSTVDNTIRNHINNTEILFYKGLFDSCEIETQKAKNLAKKYERYELLPDIIKWERILISKSNSDQNTLEGISATFEENKKALLTNLEIMNNSFNAKKFQFHIIHPDIANPTKNVLPEIESIIDTEYRSIPDESTPFPVARLHYQVKSQYYQISKQDEKAYENSVQLLKLIYSKPNIILDNNDELIIYLSNHLINCIKVNNNQDFDQTYQQIKKLKVRHPVGRSMKLKAHSLTMERYLHSNEIKKGLAIVPELENSLHRAIELHHGAFSLYYLVTTLLFLKNNDLSNSIKWNNKVINRKENYIASRKDIYLTARILEPIIHFQKKDYEFCRILNHRIERLFKKEKLFGYTEEKLFNCLKNLSDFENTKSWKTIYHISLSEFKQALQKDKKAMYFRHINFYELLETFG